MGHTRIRAIVALGAVAVLLLGLTASGATAGGVVACFDDPVTIVGTSGSDVLVGTSGRDVINGLGGDDTIRGLDSGDDICGGFGNDVIYACRWRHCGRGERG